MTTINVNGTALNQSQADLLTSTVKECIELITRSINTKLSVQMAKAYQERRVILDRLLGLIHVESDLSDLPTEQKLAIDRAFSSKLLRMADVDSWIYWHEPEHEEIWKLWVVFTPEMKVQYDAFYPQIKELA